MPKARLLCAALVLSGSTSLAAQNTYFLGQPAEVPEKRTIETGWVRFGDFDIPRHDLETWFRIYEKVRDVEFALCLYGVDKWSISGPKRYVERFDLPIVHTARPDTISFTCPDESPVGAVHSHLNPKGLSAQLTTACPQSSVDRRTFLKSDWARIEIIVCRDDTLFWVVKEMNWGWVVLDRLAENRLTYGIYTRRPLIIMMNW